jgi:hypothetical protein
VSAEIITGRLWRVGPYTLNVASDTVGGLPTRPRLFLNAHEGTGVLDATEARALSAFLAAAADVADAIERDRRAVQRIEAQARARMHVLAKQAEADL